MLISIFKMEKFQLGLTLRSKITFMALLTRRTKSKYRRYTYMKVLNTVVLFMSMHGKQSVCTALSQKVVTQLPY